MRRSEFLKYLSSGALLLAAGHLPEEVVAARKGRGLRFGVITDTHYADREPSGTRHYRDSMLKMQEAIREFNRKNLDFIIELGDMKDTTTDAAGVFGAHHQRRPHNGQELLLVLGKRLSLHSS